MSVDAGRLLRDLREAWTQVGETDAHGHGVLRACSMTLLVLSSRDDDPQRLGETLAGLMRSHPSRTIVLRRCEGAGRLEGRALVQCWMPFGRRQQICCEQIELHCTPDQMQGAMSAVLGLLVPDLPVNVWMRERAWCGAPLLQLAHKVIVDGLALGQPRASDLAWTRLTPTRQAFARAWTPGGEVAIRHPGPRRPMEAVYLAAWLRARLGPAQRIRLAADDPGSPVVLEWGAGQRQSLLPAGGDEDLLREELSVFGRDAVFEAVLEAAPEFAEAA